MGRTVRTVVRTLCAATLLASLAPWTAAAITTNIKATTPEGADYGEQLIIVDASSDLVVARAAAAQPKEDEKDRRRAGFWRFDLAAGRYYAKTPGGARSQIFEVKSPGPVDVEITLAAAAAGSATAGALSFLLDLEAGYQYTGNSYDSWAGITDINLMGQRLGPASRSFDIDTSGAHLAARIFPPVEIAHARPFLEVTGDVFGSQSGSGARFGRAGMTGLNSVDFDLDSSVGMGFGARWTVPAGPVRLAFLPTVGFSWASGKLSQTVDETRFIPGAIRTDTQRVTTSNLILGGTMQIFPFEDCGLYFYGAGGYRHVLTGDEITVSDPTPQGSRTAFSRVSVKDGWQAGGGIGYEFDLGRLGF